MQKHSTSFITQSRKVADRLLERFDRFELSRLEVLVAVRAHLSAYGYDPTGHALRVFLGATAAKVRYHLSGLAREGLVVVTEDRYRGSSVVLLTGRGLLVLDELTGKMWQSS